MNLYKLSVILLITIFSTTLIQSPLSIAQTSDVYLLDNGYFKVAVRVSGEPVGAFTVATSNNHPYPNQNVLYGGADEQPGTSALSVSLPQFNKTYSTRIGQYVPNGFTLEYLSYLNYTVSTGDNFVRIEWMLPENILFVEEIYLYGATLNDSFVEQRVRVVNYNNYPVDVWIMFMWDIMIDGEDGSVIRFWNQNGNVTDWLEYATYIGNFSNIDFWQTTNDNLNPLFYIWGSIKLPQGATEPTGFIYDDWGILEDYAWNYTVDTTNYIKGDDTAVAYLFVDTVPAASEKVYRQFILAVSGLGEQPPEIITTTITTTETTPTCTPETTTVTETETYTYTTTDTYTTTETQVFTETYTETETETRTTTETVTATLTKTIVANETVIYGLTLTPILILALLGSSVLFFILFIIMLILFVTKK